MTLVVVWALSFAVPAILTQLVPTRRWLATCVLICAADTADPSLDPSRLLALARHVERLAWTFQLFPWPLGEGGVYWSVPYGEDLALIAARGVTESESD